MTNGFKFLLAGVGSLILVLALARVASHLGYAPHPRQEAGQQDQSMAPSRQPVHSRPMSVEQFVPDAQRGLNPSQAQVLLEVETDTGTPRYKQNDLTVNANQVVSLTFRNSSDAGYQHSWVLVQPGTERQVSDAAKRAGPDAGYVPVLPRAIIAHTRLLSPGESETIVFRAPSVAGDYPYICVFPGHADALHGTLHVKEAESR